MSTRNAVMLGVTFCVSLGIRAVRYPLIVTPIGVQFPYAGDLYYHMRRIWFSVRRFPESLDFDPYVSFPWGAEIVWPATYDLAVAGLARLFVGSESQAAVEQFAIWVPPLLGAGTAALAAAIAARLFGNAAGWWSGLLFAALPISFVYSQLGNIDHQAAVALATTAMLGVALALLERGDAASPALGVGLGLATAAVILMWPGALLHAGAIQAATALWWLWAEDRRSAVRRGWILAASQAACAVALAPFCLGRDWAEYGTWSPLVLSSFQPVYFAIAAAGIALLTALHTHTDLGASRSRRAATAAGLAALSVVTVLGAAAPLRDSLRQASGWFSSEDESLIHSLEHRPLLWVSGAFDTSGARQYFGVAIFAFPVAWAALARGAWRARSAARGLLLGWTAFFLALTLVQWRFGNTFSVAYCIVIGSALAAWIEALRGHAPGSRASRAAQAVVAALLVVLAAGSLYRDRHPTLVRAIRAARDDEVRRLGPLRGSRRIFDLAGRWIAAETPPTRGYLDPGERPEYGVLCNWSVGHLLRYRSERPMVQDNFGSYARREAYDAARQYYASTDEAGAIALLEELGVRYVVAGLQGSGSATAFEPRSMAVRLGRAFGTEVTSRQGTLPALARHRLLFHVHTAPAVRNGRLNARAPDSSLGVWEPVAGARIAGRAAPGATVRASLELTTGAGRRHRFRTSTVTTPDGRYELVVPYPTDRRFSSAIRAERGYRLTSGDATARLAVPEAAVRDGDRVAGPSF